jgi:hypothetical protein
MKEELNKDMESIKKNQTKTLESKLKCVTSWTPNLWKASIHCTISPHQPVSKLLARVCRTNR